MSGNVIRIISNLVWDLWTCIASLFIKRDRNIWLFGSWMGNKFADNSRFLYQYLYDCKDIYGIKEIVWVTRNPDVVTSMKSMGYHCCLIGSKESNYYHHKAGVHVICNSDQLDIDSKRSLGAIKIQLWHGVAVKACGKMTRKKGYSMVKAFLTDKVVRPYCLPGAWGRCYFLATSEENRRVAIDDYGMIPSRVFYGTYPRLCECPRMTEDEKRIIDLICTKKKDGYKIILYLPTFRSVKSEYLEPQAFAEFNDYISKLSVLWIEKRHSAAVDKDEFTSIQNVIGLRNDFDINILYRYIDLLVTDYSSAASDAYFFNKLSLEYCPDFDMYCGSDRGFVAPFSSYHVTDYVKTQDEFFGKLNEMLISPEKYSAELSSTRDFLYGKSSGGMDELTKSIIKLYQ